VEVLCIFFCIVCSLLTSCFVARPGTSTLVVYAWRCCFGHHS
jgi:hypothetical protein